MNDGLAQDGQLLALKIHQLLRAIDPARWRAGQREQFSQDFGAIQANLERLLDSAVPARPEPRALWEDLRKLSELFSSSRPSEGDPLDVWEAFRRRALPAYDELSVSLRRLGVPVPSLRPTNYARSILHVCSGLVVLVLLQTILTPTTMLWIALPMAVAAWSLEISRRMSVQVNAFCMWVFQRVAHPHEAWKINSSTWYTTAMLVLALVGNEMIASIAVIVLALADPAAAVIGRKYGRIRLVNGRSLEGTLTFMGVAILATLLTLVVFYPNLRFLESLLLAVASAFAGGLAELFSRRVDDNLAIPAGVAAGLGAVLLVL